MSNRSSHRCVDGTWTKDTRKYLRSWRKVGRIIARATNSKLAGFDPGFLFVSKDAPSYSWGLSWHPALKLAEALENPVKASHSRAKKAIRKMGKIFVGKE
jgi:hypothetical protein